MNISRCFVFCHFKIRENKTTEFDTTMAWRTDSYYSMGVLGFGLFLLLGITSLPSVSNALSWREFSFVQVNLGIFYIFIKNVLDWVADLCLLWNSSQVISCEMRWNFLRWMTAAALRSWAHLTVCAFSRIDKC